MKESSIDTFRRYPGRFRRFENGGIMSGPVCLILGILILLLGSCRQEEGELLVRKEHYTFRLDPEGFRFSFLKPDGSPAAAAHRVSGIGFSAPGGDTVYPAVTSRLLSRNRDSLLLEVTNSKGGTARVQVRLFERYAALKVQPERSAGAEDTLAFIIDIRTAGMGPVYGLGDHGGYGDNMNVYGFSDDDFGNRDNGHRFVSNFSIFPAQGFAQVLFERGRKRVAVNASENRLGATGVREVTTWYFTGDPEQIYADYKQVREREGYPGFRPKYRFFELGYEAFGSLGWNTYQSSVQQDVDNYLSRGYPLKWVVVGSGFWKGARKDPREGSTTSFGIWDAEFEAGRKDGLPNPRYPDIEEFRRFFSERDLLLMLGLRINFKAPEEDGGHYFPPNDGPYTSEGLSRHYFIENRKGTAEKFEVHFPQGKVYLLDADDPEAVEWYVRGAEKWGVDGFKEDLMLNEGAKLNNDAKCNKVNGALMKEGYYIMARNGAYTVPGDILRLEDTKHGFDQDRPLINGLNYAASGAPAVYLDIVAGKYLVNPLTADQEIYFARNAMLAAVSPVMAMGHGPWHLQNKTFEAAVVKAAAWHDLFAPYIYSEAVKSYESGFPYAMTPLPLAFPDDTATYDLCGKSKKQYSWMLGESLLVAPLYGSDYATAQARDVYLPEGKWIDYESGRVFEGPLTLPDYSFPVDKIPAFIGGKGVLVRKTEREGSFLATVYPVCDREFDYTFYHPDGAGKTLIRKTDGAWKAGRPAVRNLTTGEKLKQAQYDPAFGSVSFPVLPGHEYELYQE